MTTTQPSQRGEQLTLTFADRLPSQFRLSNQTRQVGRRGIAAVRAVLAEQTARRETSNVMAHRANRRAA
jgi:hypothetical protein